MMRTVSVTGRVFLKQLFFSLTLPIWWYSSGARATGAFLFQSFRATSQSLGVMLWIKNIFVPMYGQTDLWGRLISFLIRIVNCIARSIGLFAWFLVLCLAGVLWIILPLAAVVSIVIGIFYL